MRSEVVFLLGMVGALAPEIVRLYELRANSDRITWSWFYVAVSALFAALGGVMAIALPATSYWAAIYAGVSTPVVINTAMKKALGQGGDPDQTLKAGQGGAARGDLAPAPPTFGAFLRAL